MTNAIDNARKALKTYESPRGSYQNDADVLYAALRDLLDSLDTQPHIIPDETALETFDRLDMARSSNVTVAAIVDHYRKLVS